MLTKSWRSMAAVVLLGVLGAIVVGQAQATTTLRISESGGASLTCRIDPSKPYQIDNSLVDVWVETGCLNAAADSSTSTTGGGTIDPATQTLIRQGNPALSNGPSASGAVSSPAPVTVQDLDGNIRNCWLNSGAVNPHRIQATGAEIKVLDGCLQPQDIVIAEFSGISVTTESSITIAAGETRTIDIELDGTPAADVVVTGVISKLTGLSEPDLYFSPAHTTVSQYTFSSANPSYSFTIAAGSGAFTQVALVTFSCANESICKPVAVRVNIEGKAEPSPTPTPTPTVTSTPTPTPTATTVLQLLSAQEVTSVPGATTEIKFRLAGTTSKAVTVTATSVFDDTVYFGAPGTGSATIQLSGVNPEASFTANVSPSPLRNAGFVALACKASDGCTGGESVKINISGSVVTGPTFNVTSASSISLLQGASGTIGVALNLNGATTGSGTIRATSSSPALVHFGASSGTYDLPLSTSKLSGTIPITASTSGTGVANITLSCVAGSGCSGSATVRVQVTAQSAANTAISVLPDTSIFSVLPGQKAIVQVQLAGSPATPIDVTATSMNSNNLYFDNLGAVSASKTIALSASNRLGTFVMTTNPNVGGSSVAVTITCPAGAGCSGNTSEMITIVPDSPPAAGATAAVALSSIDGIDLTTDPIALTAGQSIAIHAKLSTVPSATDVTLVATSSNASVGYFGAGGATAALVLSDQVDADSFILTIPQDAATGTMKVNFTCSTGVACSVEPSTVNVTIGGAVVPPTPTPTSTPTPTPTSTPGPAECEDPLRGTWSMPSSCFAAKHIPADITEVVVVDPAANYFTYVPSQCKGSFKPGQMVAIRQWPINLSTGTAFIVKIGTTECFAPSTYWDMALSLAPGATDYTHPNVGNTTDFIALPTGCALTDTSQGTVYATPKTSLPYPSCYVESSTVKGSKPYYINIRLHNRQETKGCGTTTDCRILSSSFIPH